MSTEQDAQKLFEIGKRKQVGTKDELVNYIEACYKRYCESGFINNEFRIPKRYNTLLKEEKIEDILAIKNKISHIEQRVNVQICVPKNNILTNILLLGHTIPPYIKFTQK